MQYLTLNNVKELGMLVVEHPYCNIIISFCICYVRTFHASQQPTPYSVYSFPFYLLDVTILFRRFTYKGKQCLLGIRIWNIVGL